MKIGCQRRTSSRVFSWLQMRMIGDEPGEARQGTKCLEGLNTVTLIIQNIKNKKKNFLSFKYLRKFINLYDYEKFTFLIVLE